jgi:mono/diheme cytochrome c family protein
MFMTNRAFHFVASGLTALVLAATFTALAAAGAKGSETKGRRYFRETCKECHTKGAKGGEVSPLTKTQEQWRIYFQKSKHAGGAEALNKVMPDTQLLDVQTFVINHAADSPQPETCGK